MSCLLSVQKPEVDGKELLIESRAAYTARKAAERAERKAKKGDAGEGNDGENAAKRAKVEADADPEFPKGCIMVLEGLSDVCSREDIRAALDSFGAIAFVDYGRGGDKVRLACFVPTSSSFLNLLPALASLHFPPVNLRPQATVRFETGCAAEVKAKYEEAGSAEIAGTTPTVKVLEGEEELAYWKTLLAATVLLLPCCCHPILVTLMTLTPSTDVLKPHGGLTRLV
jgi:putative RNA binding protein